MGALKALTHPSALRRNHTASSRTRRDRTQAITVPFDRPEAHVEIDGRSVRLTNLRRLFWPRLKITKGDLLQYYADMAPVLLPHLVNAPWS